MQLLKATWQHKPYWQQLLYTFMLMISFSIMLSSFALLILELTILPGILENGGMLLEASPTPEIIKGLKFTQFFYSLGFALLPAIVVAYLVGGDVGAHTNTNQKPKLGLVLLSILVIVVAIPAIEVITQLNGQLPLEEGSYFVKSHAKSEDMMYKILDMTSGYELFMNLILLALLPAVGEEFLFRGVLQKIFKGWTKNTHAAVWITGFLFAAVHMQIFNILPMLLLGALLGYLKEWTGSTWYSVIAHFTNNAFLVVLFYYFNNPDVQVDNSMLVPIISVVGTVGLLYLIRRLGKTTQIG